MRFGLRWLRIKVCQDARAQLMSRRHLHFVQFAALGVAEVIPRQASPAGLMAECSAGHRSGRRLMASITIVLVLPC
jgi:hypothetical protein